MATEELEDCPFTDDEEDIDVAANVVDEYTKKEIWRKKTLSDPRLIYEFLCTKVYGQEEACKAAAMILYTTVHGIQTSRNLFCGSSGSGKTFIFQTIHEYLWNNIVICNAANMSCDGWSGSNKVTSPFRRLDPTRPGIIVYDEFDKLVTPRYSHNENVSASLQSELLALIQPSSRYLSYRGADNTMVDIDLERISYIFCGSFTVAAENEVEKEKTPAIGFTNSQKPSPKAFDKKLTLDNIRDFGMINELCSRITRLVCLNKLEYEDFKHILADFNGPISDLEFAYDLDEGFIRTHILSDNDIEEIAHYAYEKELGVRATTSLITCKLEDYIFNHFTEYQQTH